jgi:adenylylsulfate kinase-like enzyme
VYVVFIHGPAAAGKYTIGAIVAQQLGFPLPPDLRIDTESLDPEEGAAVIVEWIRRSSGGHD